MRDEALIEEELTRSVIGAFFDVYNGLEFGFLEHVYAAALELELRERGHAVAREVSVPILYRGRVLARQRLDMVVDGRLVVETKSTVSLHPASLRQLYSYLRATRLEVGLLLHFGPSARFHRVVAPNDRPRGR
jgi:GxxExxY protein